MIEIIFGLAIISQLAAAFMVLQLVKTISNRRPWLFVSIAMITLAVLHGWMLYPGISDLYTPFTGLATGVISLIASAFMLIGIYWAVPHFLSVIQSEEVLQKQYELYQPMVEEASYSLVLKDRQSVYLATNPAFERFLGKENGNLVGKTDFDFFSRSQANVFRQIEDKVMETGIPQMQEEEVLGKEGKRWLQITRIPIIDETESSVGILVSAQDITERIEVETPLHQERQRLLALQDITLALIQQLDLTTFLQSTLTWAGKLAHTEHGFVALVEPEKSSIEIIAGAGILDKYVGAKMKLGEGLAGQVWQTGQTVVVNQYQDWPDLAGRIHDQNLGSSLGVPLLSGSEVIGVLGLIHTKPDQIFDQDAVKLLKLFAQIASMALQNARHYDSTQRALAENSKTIDALKYRVRLERLIAAMASYFINLAPEKIDQGIKQALQTIGQFAQVDRSYIYLFPRDGQEKDTFHEWCANGIPSRSGSLREFHENGFSWWVGKLHRMETIHIARLSDLPPEATDTANMLESQGIKSFTAIPLVAGRSLLGYLGLEAVQTEIEWPQDILGLHKITGDMFINALQRKWTAKERDAVKEQINYKVSTLEQRDRENSMLTEMADLLLACRTADEAYPIIARYTKGLIPRGSGALYLISNSDDPAENVASWGESPPGPHEHYLALNECWALRRGRTHLVTDNVAGPLCGHINEPLPDAYLCTPLIAQGEAVGLLHMRSDPQEINPLNFLETHQQIAITIAEHIALALSNLNLRDKLRSQAIRDPLTGLFNRRYMEETLDREIRRANRHGTTVGVIMFDIDRLKPVNDTFGHDAGDTLLRGLGGLMLKKFRGEDVACRYGGDEFTIIVPEASLADVWQRAEELREEFKKLSLEHEGKHLGTTTLSIGVAGFPDHGATPEQLIRISDTAAYVAKAQGGDRVTVGRPSED